MQVLIPPIFARRTRPNDVPFVSGTDIDTLTQERMTGALCDSFTLEHDVIPAGSFERQGFADTFGFRDTPLIRFIRIEIEDEYAFGRNDPIIPTFLDSG